MMNLFTPEETRDIPKNKKSEKGQAFTENKPSQFTLRFVYGYAAALSIVQTKSLGNLKILVN